MQACNIGLLHSATPTLNSMMKKPDAPGNTDGLMLTEKPYHNIVNGLESVPLQIPDAEANGPSRCRAFV
jgi:hypothetical protein